MGLVDRQPINTEEDKEKGLVSKGMPEANAYIARWVSTEDRNWIYLFYSKRIEFKPPPARNNRIYFERSKI